MLPHNLIAAEHQFCLIFFYFSNQILDIICKMPNWIHRIFRLLCQNWIGYWLEIWCSLSVYYKKLWTFPIDRFLVGFFNVLCGCCVCVCVFVWVCIWWWGKKEERMKCFIVSCIDMHVFVCEFVCFLCTTYISG